MPKRKSKKKRRGKKKNDCHKEVKIGAQTRTCHHPNHTSEKTALFSTDVAGGHALGEGKTWEGWGMPPEASSKRARRRRLVAERREGAWLQGKSKAEVEPDQGKL